MATTTKIVFCTGANTGLGYSLIKAAGLRYPEKYTFILGSRDVERGNEAVAKLRADGVTGAIDVVKIDVNNDDEVSEAVTFVEKKYGRLDALINNAGILRRVEPCDSLSHIRETYNELLNTHISSVAVVTEGFTSLLRKSADPKVISVTSGLASCHNALRKKMGRSAAYGSSKVGLNGLMVHLQVAENDRIAAAATEEEKQKPVIRYYVCAPGPCNTGFVKALPIPKNFDVSKLRTPDRGAEVMVRLMADDEGTYEGGSHWEYEEDEMRQVPW
ncbi:short chain dehydrogenase/reductase family protein [Xylariaceae sp. FL0255]|nr:short chain dehydrogenase/reductase family protein [Xylariaceae sp. FL0255]